MLQYYIYLTVLSINETNALSLLKVSDNFGIETHAYDMAYLHFACEINLANPSDISE